MRSSCSTPLSTTSFRTSVKSIAYSRVSKSLRVNPALAGCPCALRLSTIARPARPTSMTPNPATQQAGPVLLIDDDEFIAGSLRDYLVTRGLCVDVALEPAVAERLMSARQYATVVVDPFLTGGVYGENASLLDTIHRLQPGTAVVILTGYGSAAMIH